VIGGLNERRSKRESVKYEALQRTLSEAQTMYKKLKTKYKNLRGLHRMGREYDPDADDNAAVLLANRIHFKTDSNVMKERISALEEELEVKNAIIEELNEALKLR